MSKRQKLRFGKATVLASLAVHLIALHSVADDGGRLATAARNANQNAEARYKNYAAFWHRTMADAGSKSRLRRMAQEVASFDEKVAQGFDLFESGSTPPNERMRVSFRRHVVDERELAQMMVGSFVKFQEELIKESIDLYVKAGVDRDTATALFQARGIDGTPWLDDFSPLIAKAKSLAREDWWRVGAITVGSGIAVDQAMQTEEPTWRSFFASLITQAAVETALEYATDPSDRFAESLSGEFDRATASLLTGNHGLLTAMRRLTDEHLKIRNRHFGVISKGGK
ncbi:MAG: hypothetical protein KDB27_13005 [Planctomycetales bacterium]|nr:hypothetical protein [Planctomycetales bacterium]